MGRPTYRKPEKADAEALKRAMATREDHYVVEIPQGGRKRPRYVVVPRSEWKEKYRQYVVTKVTVPRR